MQQHTEHGHDITRVLQAEGSLPLGRCHSARARTPTRSVPEQHLPSIPSCHPTHPAPHCPWAPQELSAEPVPFNENEC